MFPKISISGFSNTACVALAQASLAAYSKASEIEGLARAAGAERFQFIESEDTQCFLALRGEDLVIAFRGTESPGDWLTDAKCRREPFKAGAKCSVHRGFLAAFASVKAQILATVSEWGANRIWITGHSLGGALAILCAGYLRRNVYFPVGVYTFGCPRVGNASFAQAYDSNLRDVTFRIVNEEDIVPRVPGVLAGYRHVGQEIFMDSFGSVLVNPTLLNKITSDIWGFIKSFDTDVPALTAMNAIRDHAMADYLKRINS